ncbi:MAG: LON peptidase substrate-binding domain-containing protein [Gemmatimonadaceae bacterium]|nr:LON peptidase substrate-binding domain-containing protein [Gemmatimonadaceae bacterium]
MITSPIPIFPLGLVLLPGASVPLHLFEPRYRAMLADISGSSKRFGLIAPPPATSEANLPAGRIGCIALITEQEALPDGRANILVEGTARFRFETYLEIGTPYRVAHIDEWTDVTDEPVALELAAAHLRSLANRAIVASMTLHDIDGDPPEFDDAPATLSYQVAQLLLLDNETLYSLLAERSPLRRIEHLDGILSERLPDIEEAAELHRQTQSDTDGDESDGRDGPRPG